MMAKLYWRVKRNGKWTWRPANVVQDNHLVTWVRNWKMDPSAKEEEE